MFAIPIGEIINIWFLYQWRWLPNHVACARARGSACMLATVLAVSLGGWLALAAASSFLQDAIRGASERGTIIGGLVCMLLQFVIGMWLSWTPPPPPKSAATTGGARRQSSSPWFVMLTRGSLTCASCAARWLPTAALHAMQSLSDLDVCLCVCRGLGAAAACVLVRSISERRLHPLRGVSTHTCAN